MWWTLCCPLGAQLPPASSTPQLTTALPASFLAFAYHAGFLEAVEDAGLRVRCVFGTSAGALAGALYAAGHPPRDVASILSSRPPASYLSLHGRAWRGVFRLDGAVERLRELLPATFEELRMPLAVGVVDASGQHRALCSGPLPHAVAASFAIPGLFVPVSVPGADGGPFADGGVADRVGLALFERTPLRGGSLCGAGGGSAAATTLVHLIERSSRFSGADEVGDPAAVVVRSPRAAQSLWALPDFQVQRDTARARTARALAAQGARGRAGALAR